VKVTNNNNTNTNNSKHTYNSSNNNKKNPIHQKTAMGTIIDNDSVAKSNDSEDDGTMVCDSESSSSSSEIDSFYPKLREDDEL
jgi:hypothetical protein